MRFPALTTLLASAAVIFAAPSITWAQRVTFVGVGDLPGGDANSYVHDISADGKVVVGSSEFEKAERMISANEGELAGIQQAFRWSEAGGIVGLGNFDLKSRSGSIGFAASSDGTTIAGFGSQIINSRGSIVSYGFVWTRAGGLENLGTFPGAVNCGMLGISADGRVLVGRAGYAWDNGIPHSLAVRWDATDRSWLSLGDLTGGPEASHATAVSADGQVIVGHGTNEQGQQAMRWTATDGMVGLGDLPGGEFKSTANAVSADGKVIIGRASIAGSLDTSFRWTKETGLTEIKGMIVYDLSRDGSLMVGSRTERGLHAAVWNQSGGVQRLSDLLTRQFQVDLTGWDLTSAKAVSDDGLTIAGNGRHTIDGKSVEEGWVVRIEQPPAKRSGAKK